MPHIYPSLISADLLNLSKVIEAFDKKCIGYHIDIMDNRFVHNLIFGVDIANAIARKSINPLWVHLMCENPMEWISKLQVMEGSLISFHFETQNEIKHVIRYIREKNFRPSIAINPKTNVEEVFPFLNEIDQVLLMSVEPGYAGQPFLKSVMNKIDPLIGIRQTDNLSFRIGIDGGITAENIQELAQRGVDDFAIASGIFGTPDPLRSLEVLQKMIGEK